MYITPPIMVSMYRQPLGGWKGHLLPSCKDSLKTGIVRGQVTGRNLSVWQRSVCPHKQRLWKTSSILSWMPHVMFEKGGVEAVMALFVCWSVERLWFLHWDTCAVLAQPLWSLQWDLWLAAPFPWESAAASVDTEQPWGQAWQDGPCRRRSSSAFQGDLSLALLWWKLRAGPWQPTSAHSHTCPDRDLKSTLFEASTCKGQKAQLSQRTEHGHWDLPVVLMMVVSQSPSSLAWFDDRGLFCNCFGQINAGTRKLRCFI